MYCAQLAMNGLYLTVTIQVFAGKLMVLDVPVYQVVSTGFLGTLLQFFRYAKRTSVSANSCQSTRLVCKNQLVQILVMKCFNVVDRRGPKTSSLEALKRQIMCQLK